MPALPAYLHDIQRDIEGHARDYGLDFWECHFEILDYKRMQEVAAFGGFPVRYPHWRFGMDFEHLTKSHVYGLSHIYEMVINNNPAYAYLLEGNSLVDQKMVIAHVLGHVDFFKNNYFFSKTNRKMIDQMANHATRVRRHIERLGLEKVEGFIDACLCLENLIDPMSPFIVRRPPEKPPDTRTAQGALTPWGGKEPEPAKEVPRLRAKDYMDGFINPPDYVAEQRRKLERERDKPKKFPAEPERDVLLFLLMHAPLEAWERDILELVRAEAYYFAPQRQTKILNEGWAAYWHSKIMTEKALKASEIIDYADHNAGVLSSAPGQFNPYKVGISLLRHIEERWDKGRFGKEWSECDDYEARRTWDKRLGLGRQKIYEVRKLYNDVTFIDEFFTEEFCRENQFFSFALNERSGNYEIDSREFQKIKHKLLFQLTNFGEPFIVVEDANHDNRGEMLLFHRHEGLDLHDDHARATLSALERVWRRPVTLRTVLEGKSKLLRFDGKDHTEKAG
jgi:stage V sporulation protein R